MRLKFNLEEAEVVFKKLNASKAIILTEEESKALDSAITLLKASILKDIANHGLKIDKLQDEIVNSGYGESTNTKILSLKLDFASQSTKKKNTYDE